MIRNYLTLGLRNIAKHKSQSIIAIVGLSIGLMCAILMFLFVREELRYDRFHPDSDRLYRVIREVKSGDGETSYNPLTSGPLADVMMRDLLEVEAVTRTWHWAAWFQLENRWLSESVAYVDPNFFDVLGFPIVRGDRETVFQEPYSIVMTEQMATRYFGNDDPIGKTLTLDRDSIRGTYTVTGVVQLPRQSSLTFDFLISTAPPIIREHLEVWKPRQLWSTYVKLKKNASVAELEGKLPNIVAPHKGNTWIVQNVYHLQPMTRIYLHSNADYGMEPWRGNNIQYLYLVSLTGVFVLLIACVNFVNLSTARSVLRAREVGIRKVVGAHRHQLVGQFLGESMMVTGLALVLAIGLAEILLPLFNDLSGKQLVFFEQMDGMLILGLIGIALIVGLLSGLYPAFALSGFQTLSVLKGGIATSLRGRTFRNGLVVFQFALSVLFLIATAVVYRQIDFMQHKDLGFDKDQVVMLDIFRADRTFQKPLSERLALRYNEVKKTFLAHPNILKATASRQRGPGDGGRMERVQADGVAGDQKIRVQAVDEDFLDVYDIRLVAGQKFSFGQKNSFLVNEMAVRRFGWANAVGKVIEVGDRAGMVVGVVKDYHSRSLYEPIEPVILLMSPPDFLHVSLKIDGKDVSNTLSFLEQTWLQWIPKRSFRFHFTDDWLNRAYRDDVKFGEIARVASVFAIFVACLGLFGLTSFMAVRRTKEIGIRKVLGASILDVVVMLSKDFLKPVVLANVIAWPVAYWAMERWLADFTYRTELSFWLFVWSACMVIVMAVVTVSYQAIRAARANPVTALRYE